MNQPVAQPCPAITIGGRRIADDQPCYVIGEIGVNHDGDVAKAVSLIDAAADAGCDAVKFQTFSSDALASQSAQKAAYQETNSGQGSQVDMLRELELSFAEFVQLRDHCSARDVDFISTAFDQESLNWVLSLKPPCLKWPSGELTNLPFLRQAARSGLPMIVSTGMGTLEEVAAAANVLNEENCPFAILQCVSNYPARIEEQNLRTIPAMSAQFSCPAGFSDHTIGPWASIAARGLGMTILEKHITLDRTANGPDHAASAQPGEFAELVKMLRAVEAGLGDGIKCPTPGEEDVRRVARKSLFYVANLPEGHLLGADDLTAKRPGTGLAPSSLELLLGKRLRRAVAEGSIVELSDVG